MTFAPPPFVTGLQCLTCSSRYAYGNLFTCTRCGGILDVQYDYDSASRSLGDLSSRPPDQWRYRELLPVSPQIPPPYLHVGWSPVYEVPRLAHALGTRKLFLKDEGRNPTGSFKDRASAIAVLKAREFGFTSVACASTGNAASSLAGFAAATGLQCFVFVPDTTPEAKIAQLLIFGATVLRVEGSYDEAYHLCKLACDQFGWYSRNCATNPFLVEGKKTAGLEIAEAFPKVPDWIAVSVGDGCTIGGIGKGFGEMKILGIIDRIPRLLGVQAEGASALADAFSSGRSPVPSGTSTIADSIAVKNPRNWSRAIQQVKSSGGDMVTVSDEDILGEMRMTARLGAVFGEPAGAASIAGIKKAVEMNIIKSNESALAVVTASGLKDFQSARKAAGREYLVKPSLDAVAEALSSTALDVG